MDSYIFTDAQGVDLSEWYRDHELFYDKKLKHRRTHRGSSAYWKERQASYAHHVLVGLHMCQKCELDLN